MRAISTGASTCTRAVALSVPAAAVTSILRPDRTGLVTTARLFAAPSCVAALREPEQRKLHDLLLRILKDA